MEDQVPIIVLKTQFFLPRKLRHRMNYFWAFKEPKNPAIEMKIRKMKRKILNRASLCAEAVYSSWKKFVDDKDELQLESLEAISNQIQAGILFTPKKLRNAIYSRMLEEAADAQFVAAEEAAAAAQFIEEVVAAALLVKEAAAAAQLAKEAAAASKFAKEAAAAALLAKEAAAAAQLAKFTKETASASQLAKKATLLAKKAAAAAHLAEDEATPEATPEEAVVEEKLGKLLLEGCRGGECKGGDCREGDCKGKTRETIIKRLNFF